MITADHTSLELTTDPRKLTLKGVTMHGGLSFEVPYMTEIADNLWQGGCVTGLVLPPEIEQVVSLYPWEQYQWTREPKSFLAVFAYDEPSQDPGIFNEVATWVIAARKSGPVLVHCQAGLNRSSVVTSLVLMRDEGLSPQEAVSLLREKRSPACLCNPAFEAFILNGGGGE